MARRRRPPAPGRTARNESRAHAATSTARKPGRAAAEPEEAARAAMAHEAQASPSGDKIKLPLTIALSRAQAERLTARAIREGKNLDALVAEILEGAPSGELKRNARPRRGSS